MTMALISASEMAALRGVAEAGMTTNVMILARTTTRTDDGSKDTWATSGPVVQGWLYEMTSPGAAIGVISGEMGLASLFRLLLPVGTVVQSGDHVLIGGATYVVEHTNSDNTHLPVLNLAVRKLE
jgi:hypothetical protein